ncbi:hypothetical protein J6590_004961 [Homalodisca vitripennis]|nr:hypothetical protein J6590_004961 [Homalodisca vitripennis]
MSEVKHRGLESLWEVLNVETMVENSREWRKEQKALSSHSCHVLEPYLPVLGMAAQDARLKAEPHLHTLRPRQHGLYYNNCKPALDSTHGHSAPCIETATLVCRWQTKHWDQADQAEKIYRHQGRCNSSDLFPALLFLQLLQICHLTISKKANVKQEHYMYTQQGKLDIGTGNIMHLIQKCTYTGKAYDKRAKPRDTASKLYKQGQSSTFYNLQDNRPLLYVARKVHRIPDRVCRCGTGGDGIAGGGAHAQGYLAVDLLRRRNGPRDRRSTGAMTPPYYKLDQARIRLVGRLVDPDRDKRRQSYLLADPLYCKVSHNPDTKNGGIFLLS